MDWYWPTDDDVAAELPGYRPTTQGHFLKIREAAELILRAERPILYVGGGVLKARAAEALRELAELTDIRVVTTLMARGAFPDSHPLCLGMPGMHGNYTAVTAMQRSDLLVALGSRFDDRVTGKVPAFAPDAKIVHVDIDPAELGKVRRPDVPIVGDCRLVIEELIRAIHQVGARDDITTPDRQPWNSTISGWQERYPLAYAPPVEGDALKPQMVLEHLRDSSPDDTILVSGVGQHQMWCSQYWKFDHPYTWVNSGGLGTMGFSVPAAIGAKVGRPDRTVWSVDGDGCFQMTAQELDHRLHRAHPGQGRHPQQRLPRHGAPVAGDVLRGALLRGVPVARPARLREVGRGDGVHRHPRGVARRDPARHRQGELDRRPTRRGRVPHRRAGEGLPDGRGRSQQRRDPGAPLPGRAGPMTSGRPRLHSLSVLVENKAGVLLRVAGLFARRGYNIYSLAVAPTDDDRFSRITIVVDVDSAPLEQMVKQLHKLINVIKITELDPRDSVERELLLATVKVGSERRNEVIELVQIFEGRILAVGHDALTVSLDGSPAKIDDFEELLRPFGIAELQRTGRVALPKLERDPTARHRPARPNVKGKAS